jgi:hypothetical protein
MQLSAFSQEMETMEPIFLWIITLILGFQKLFPNFEFDRHVLSEANFGTTSVRFVDPQKMV